LFPYWLLFSIFAAGSLEYRRRGGVGSQAAPLLVVAGLVTALMIGLRYRVGGDWYSYEATYFDYGYRKLGAVLLLSDPGYGVVNWLGRRLGFEVWFANLVCGTIFSWGLVKFARRQPNPWLAILIAVPYLIIVVAMGYTRQAVAIGLILAGLSVVDRTSILRFSGYILVAATFHKSAIIMLPLVALAATQQRIVTVGLLVVLAAIIYYLFVQSSVDRLLTGYVEAGYSSQGAGVRVAMNLPPAILFLLFANRFSLSKQQKKLWTNFSLAAFAALWFLIFTASSTAVDRVALYLIPLQIFVLSRLPEAFPGRSGANGQIIFAIIAYSALIQFVWLNYAVHAPYWLPYQLFSFTG